jgi:SAM-dependent methyltransferase
MSFESKLNVSNKITLGLSRKLKVPVLYWYGNTYPLWKYWKMKEISKLFPVCDKHVSSLLMRFGFEYYKACHPNFDLTNKTVLDVGAGCGETAFYFLRYAGAKHVICIENHPGRIEALRFNKDACALDITVVGEDFKVQHLDMFDYDFIKMNIEGFEELLYDEIDGYKKLKPCWLQAHNWYAVSKMQKLGFRILSTDDPMMGDGYMVNY